MFIRLGNSCSTKFRVTNGVKQGGVLSPALFNVYMNNLGVSLNNSGIGGSQGGNLINHLCYADDLCLIYMFLFTIIINGSAFKSIQTCKHNYVIYTMQINNNNKLQ